MNTTRQLALAALAIPLTLGLASVADDLSFHPAKDAKSQKELRIEGEFRIEDAAMSVNGDPIPNEIRDQMTSQEILLSLAVDVTETFLASKDGAPTDLLRAYEKIEAKAEVGDAPQSPESSNPLEGKVVRFQWDDKGQEYKKSFHESTGDDAALEGLIDDMEVRALLPDKKVSAGDTWEVEAADMLALFFPGGIAMGGGDASEGPDLEKLGDEMTQQLEDAFQEFKIACTYKGAKDDGGTSLGEIAFTYDGKGSIDLDPIFQQIVEELGEGAPEIDLDATASLSLKGEGVLLWDLATGVLHSYEMKCDVGLELDVQVQGDQNGQQFEASMSGTLGGDVTWELTRK